MVRSILVIVILAMLLIVPVTGHSDDQHNTEFEWRWHSSIERGDEYSWNLIVDNPEDQFTEEITVIVEDDVSDINIVARLEDDPTFLVSGSSFDMEFESSISNYVIMYPARSLLLPIVLEYPPNQTTVFEAGKERSFGLPYIFLSLNVSSSDTSISFDRIDDYLIIEGNFSSFYYIPLDILIRNGTFTASYHFQTGILEGFNWETTDERYSESIEIKQNMEEKVAFSNYFIVALTISIILRKLKRRNGITLTFDRVA